MYRYKDIRHVHIEPTTKCNARCPMCGRNAYGMVRPGLRLTELRLDDCQRIFPSRFIRNLEGMDFCGAYGDPAAARYMLEVVEYIRRENSKIEINVFTNGGLRSAIWWQRLGEIIGRGKVVFAIDGLADTNHIYRRGTDFRVIIRNARAFIQAGGHAQWDFIVFKHNEHQVQQARCLSVDLGFETFQVKLTSRFYKPLYEIDPALQNVAATIYKYPIYDADESMIGVLEIPTDPKYRNSSLEDLHCLSQRLGSLNRYFNTTLIDCKAKQKKSVFISATGLVYPCCWLYNQANYDSLYGVTDPLELGVQKIIRTLGGIQRFSAKKRSLQDVIEDRFFKLIEESWSYPDLDQGRLKVCARMCGSVLNQYEKQFESEELIPGVACN